MPLNHHIKGLLLEALLAAVSLLHAWPHLFDPWSGQALAAQETALLTHLRLNLLLVVLFTVILIFLLCSS